MHKKIQENISLKPYNTFGIDVRARYFSDFTSVESLEELLNEKKSDQLLVLGGGSNVLLTKDVDGFVLKNEIKGIQQTRSGDQHVLVTAGAGESWHGVVEYCLANNLGGIENLALIPGSTGAAPMQNIGAYGVELRDVFDALKAYDRLEKEVVEFKSADCNFGYRESVFKNKYKERFIILQVTLRLTTNHQLNVSYGAIRQELEAMQVQDPTIQDVAAAVIKIRRSKLPDPEVIGNAGSFFKNPVIGKHEFEVLKNNFPAIVGFATDDNQVKLAAGWLIEQCGWKGFRKGDAGCHAQQALVLVNYGKASGGEIYELSEEIKVSVKEKFGVGLEREVNII